MKGYTYIAIILFLFDLSALWVGIHPHVSSLYKQCYIEKTMTIEAYVKKTPMRRY